MSRCPEEIHILFREIERTSARLELLIDKASRLLADENSAPVEGEAFYDPCRIGNSAPFMLQGAQGGSVEG